MLPIKKILAVGLVATTMAIFAFSSGLHAAQERKTICHKPGTSAQKTLVVPSPAVPGHMRHGDITGACLPPPTSVIIGPAGGQISIPGFATVTFPAGVFPGTQRVKLVATSSAETALDFDEGKDMFRVGWRTPYELRLNSGMAKPQTDFQAVITVSADFLAQVPSDSEIQVFAQIFQDGGEEIIDNFVLFDSIYSATDNTVTVTLPPETFTNRRHVDRTYEAIILLATTPTKPAAVSTLQNQSFGIGEEQPLPHPADAIIARVGCAEVF